jgi:hypothetical protein
MGTLIKMLFMGFGALLLCAPSHWESQRCTPPPARPRMSVDVAGDVAADVAAAFRRNADGCRFVTLVDFQNLLLPPTTARMSRVWGHPPTFAPGCRAHERHSPHSPRGFAAFAEVAGVGRYRAHERHCPAFARGRRGCQRMSRSRTTSVPPRNSRAGMCAPAGHVPQPRANPSHDRRPSHPAIAGLMSIFAQLILRPTSTLTPRGCLARSLILPDPTLPHSPAPAPVSIAGWAGKCRVGGGAGGCMGCRAERFPGYPSHPPRGIVGKATRPGSRACTPRPQFAPDPPPPGS